MLGYTGLVLICVGVFVIGGGVGFCQWCKKWTEGEIGYVADVEHDSAGNAETGFWLQWSRVWEMIGTPICIPINKMLGRKMGDGK